MVVQHNLTAMNSNRNLGITTSNQAKSTEKLSSGFKINRAADDAAGLSISEKMRKQIRGLTQATANAQDGISAVQTAEGALTEVHDMLQRMNELAVKSSNGTMSENDRDYVQSEVDQLVTEIDRVSATTKFNETYLLKGNADGTVADAGDSDATLLTGLTASLAGGADVGAQDVALGTVGVNSTIASTDDATAAITTAGLSGAALTALNGGAAGEMTVTRGASAGDSWQINGTGATYTAAQMNALGVNITDAGTAGNAQTLTISKELTANTSLPTGVSTSGTVAAADLASMDVEDSLLATIKVDSSGVSTIEAYDATYIPEDLEMNLQVGADANSDNKIELTISAMSAKGLSLLNADGRLLVNGADSTNADAAVTTIGNAIQSVSTQRSTLGAVQNRLEHTINNLDNVVENTTAAESAIRDTDMAEEMVKYSNNNILTQAGQAMLAQANQSNQGVLSLLQ